MIRGPAYKAYASRLKAQAPDGRTSRSDRRALRSDRPAARSVGPPPSPPDRPRSVRTHRSSFEYRRRFRPDRPRPAAGVQVVELAGVGRVDEPLPCPLGGGQGGQRAGHILGTGVEPDEQRVAVDRLALGSVLQDVVAVEQHAERASRPRSSQSPFGHLLAVGPQPQHVGELPERRRSETCGAAARVAAHAARRAPARTRAGPRGLGCRAPTASSVSGESWQ